MMYLALKDQRISRAVVLEIKLEVVSRPGVLFCDINAASTVAKASDDPTVIHFETVRANSQHSLRASERRFFQGEVLVPGWIPPPDQERMLLQNLWSFVDDCRIQV